MLNQMQILFNLLYTGLGDNGGSLSIIKSANTLSELGHDVKIVSSGSNYNTWEKLKVPHVIPTSSGGPFPSADVVIATGIKSVASTNMFDAKLKLHWIRGWEIWNRPEKKIVKILKESPTIKIVNSICLQNKLKQFGIDPYVIRPGYDFDDYFPINIRIPKQVVLGGLYNEGGKRKTKRTQWIFECYKRLKDKFGQKLSLVMYGNEGFPSIQEFVFYSNPTIPQKNYVYNTTDIWLVPSELEGLHIPPAEAMLTGAVPVTTSAEMSGTQDYITHNETGIVSENNLESFIMEVEKLVKDPEKRKRLGEKGRERILSLGDRTTNMKRLIELLETLKGE